MKDIFLKRNTLKKVESYTYFGQLTTMNLNKETEKIIGISFE